MIKPIKIRKIKKPLWYLRPVIVIASLFFTMFRKIKIKKINCQNLKWPYIVFASHASMLDFSMNAIVTFPHHANYISSNEEFVGREWLFYGAGCFPKRKFTKDITVVKNVLRITKRLRNGVTVYPEARYSLIGINERIDGSLGKMIKAAKVPAVVMITNGNFIHQPQWRKKYKTNNPHEVIFNCVATQEEVETLSAEEIQKRAQAAYDADRKAAFALITTEIKNNAIKQAKAQAFFEYTLDMQKPFVDTLSFNTIGTPYNGAFLSMFFKLSNCSSLNTYVPGSFACF